MEIRFMLPGRRGIRSISRASIRNWDSAPPRSFHPAIPRAASIRFSPATRTAKLFSPFWKARVGKKAAPSPGKCLTRKANRLGTSAEHEAFRPGVWLRFSQVLTAALRSCTEQGDLVYRFALGAYNERETINQISPSGAKTEVRVNLDARCFRSARREEARFAAPAWLGDRL